MGEDCKIDKKKYGWGFPHFAEEEGCLVSGSLFDYSGGLSDPYAISDELF